MNKIIEEIFNKYSLVSNKLVEYGFALQNDKYTYAINIANDQMRLTITINKNGEIETEVFDLESEEIYNLFLVENAVGSFVGEVKSEYENILTDIRDKCFSRMIFKSNYAIQITDYIKNTYNDRLEFLWDKTPDNAIARRQDNNKWYLTILTAKGSSIGLNSDKKVELLNIREEPEKVAELIDNINYFPAYHMNKKHWITIILDCTLPIERIFEHIDKSYKLASAKKK